MRNAIVATGLCMLTSFGCSKESPSEALSGKNYSSAEALFDRLRESANDVDETQMLHLSCEWNTQTGEIRVLDAAVEEIPFNLPSSLFIQTGGGTYTVHCCCNSDGNNLWTRTCDGRFSCGSAISDCLDAGGCATICNATIYYTPNDGEIHIDLPTSS